jgi:hypothetical protein
MLCLHHPFPGNGFKQWGFFSFALLGLLVTAAHAGLNCKLNYSAISSQPRLHNSTELTGCPNSLLYNHLENTVSNNNSIVVEACLPICA